MKQQPPAARPPASTIEFQTALQNAKAAYLRGDLAEAERLGRMVIATRPDHVVALQMLGLIAAQAQRPAEAYEWFMKAAANGADRQSDLHSNLGTMLARMNRPEDALKSYDRAIALKPDYAEAFNNRGMILRGLKRIPEALDSFARAIALKPDFALAWNNQGIALGELGRPEEALASFERAIALNPGIAEAHYNRGCAMIESRRTAEAIASFDRALAVRPDYAEALNNRGCALRDVLRPADAIDSFERALALRPDYAEAYNNRGHALLDLKRSAEAAASFAQALALAPDLPFVAGMHLFSKLLICEWSQLQERVERLEKDIGAGRPVCPPFPLLALSGSAALQKAAAEVWTKEKAPPLAGSGAVPRVPAHGKIRIGYYSADFFSHATSYLMAELFELHDRSAFELIGFDFSPHRDAMSRRVSAAFDRFIDVRGMSDAEVAGLSRELEVDIAVDLKGHTEHCRLGIFARRAAPIQVNYLGYPGTMGAAYFDYIVADRILIPAGSQTHYSEKIVYLPGSYQVNDRKRSIADTTLSRAQLGLPADAFVYCCFNYNYKITPAMFDVWMRILRRVEGSVLWLLEDNAGAVANLRAEAERRGVSSARLVFAPRLPLPEHLARQRRADLFLDTLPCNAHTTASDALWAGLPLLTCTGEAFASRVAASLLAAAGLGELAVASLPEYEARAVELALDPQALAAYRARLNEAHVSAPLFDTPRYARNLEAAYRRMVERLLDGLAPEDIDVAA